MTIRIQLEGLGRRLREERERLGFSQDRFADKAGVTRASQSRYEAGRFMPPLDYLDRLARDGLDILYVISARKGDDCVFVENQALFGRAVEAVNDMMARHNVRPPASFRGQAVLHVQTLMAEGRAGADQLSLDDLLAPSS